MENDTIKYVFYLMVGIIVLLTIIFLSMVFGFKRHVAILEQQNNLLQVANTNESDYINWQKSQQLLNQH